MRAWIAIVPLTIIFAACVGDNSPVPDGGGGDATTCTKVCNETCVSGTDPATGCGASSCDPCPASSAPHEIASCNAGACASACETGYVDCDNNVANGCETNVATDTSNCGKCGVKCGTANTSGVSCGTSSAGVDAGASDGGTSGPVSCQFQCTGNYAHCSSDPSTGCETDLGIDKLNCGACGHSCQGGVCAAGTCQPLVIAGDPLTPLGLSAQYGITQIGGFVYGINWYNVGSGGTGAGGIVFKTPTDGSYGGKAPPWVYGAGLVVSATGIFSNGTDFVYGIFRQDSGGPAPGIYAFTTSNNSVKNIIVGQGSTGTCPQNPGSDISSVALDSTYIYWTNVPYGGGSACPGIYRASVTDGTGRIQVLTTDTFPTLLADNGSVYMLDSTNSSLLAALGSSLSTTSVLATFPTVGSGGFALAVDGTYAYVFHGTQEKVYRVKKVGGGTPEDITPAKGTLVEGCNGGFIVDASKIYCASSTKIYSFNKDGTSPSETTMATVANGDTTYGPLTQDATSIYWASAGTKSGTYSTVYKLAK